MKKLTEWLDEQPDYGLCDPPMKAQVAFQYLVEYLIPDYYVAMPESTEQLNTALVYEILSRYSKTFRKELRKQALKTFFERRKKK